MEPVAGSFSPSVDIAEDEDRYVVTVEVPKAEEAKPKVIAIK